MLTAAPLDGTPTEGQGNSLAEGGAFAGSFTYTAGAGFTGWDDFGYVVTHAMDTSDDREFPKIVGGSELQATGGSAAAGKVDLLTIVMHEFSHQLGLHDLPAAVFPHHILTESISRGSHRTPTCCPIALTARLPAHNRASYSLKPTTPLYQRNAARLRVLTLSNRCCRTKTSGGVGE